MYKLIHFAHKFAEYPAARWEMKKRNETHAQNGIGKISTKWKWIFHVTQTKQTFTRIHTARAVLTYKQNLCIVLSYQLLYQFLGTNDVVGPLLLSTQYLRSFLSEILCIYRTHKSINISSIFPLVIQRIELQAKQQLFHSIPVHIRNNLLCWYLIYCDCKFISCTPSGVELMSKSLFDQTRIRFISRWKCWWWWYLSMWSARNAFRTLMAWIHHYRTNEIKYTLYFWTTIEWVWFKCDFDFKFEQNPIHLCSSTKCTRIQCLYTLVSFLEILKWEIITWKWGPLMANMSFHKKSFS